MFLFLSIKNRVEMELHKLFISRNNLPLRRAILKALGGLRCKVWFHDFVAALASAFLLPP